MIPILLIRHGVTQWNTEGRIQGQTDIPLSAQGRQEVARQSLPWRFAGFGWVASPLARAKETAQRMGATDLRCDWRLAEMSWGEWEGRTLADLRKSFGPDMLDNEKRGLDFRPPGGESPRLVQARLQSWLQEIAAAAYPVVAVTHKGVIRAALTLATGWEMTGKPPHILDWRRGHLFGLDTGGRLQIAELNVDLVTRDS